MDALLGPDEIRLREDFRVWAQREFAAPAGSAGPRGIFGPDLAEKLGLRALGSGLDGLESGPRVPALRLALMLEGVASARPEAGFRLAEHAGLCIPFIRAFGRPDQRERFLPALAAGRSMGSWLWVETGAVERRRDGGVALAGNPFVAADTGTETAVVLRAAGDGTADRGVEAFVFDKQDVRPAGGSEAEFLLPDSCRLDVGEEGFVTSRAVVQASSAPLLGAFLGAAAGLLESCQAAARSRGAFETQILEGRDVQVRLSEGRVGLEAVRWLTYRALLRVAAGASGEEPARRLAETLPFMAGVLDLAGRLDVPGWGLEPAAAEAAGARRARALLTSLGHILA